MTTLQNELIRLAALRNCEGASLLAEQDLDEAIARFAVAYHCIGRARRVQGIGSLISDSTDLDTDHDEENDYTSSDEAEDETVAIPADSVDRFHFILDSAEVAWYAVSRRQDAWPPMPILATTGPEHFVYGEGLVFHPESASDPEESSFFEAVILFNMGVTFHQQGRIHHSDSSILSSSSLSADKTAAIRGLLCYSQCLKRLKEGRYDHSTQAAHANMIVEAHMLIACLNNKAQVLVELGDYHEAFWMLQELGPMLLATAGDPPGFEAAEVRGLEGTMELLNTPEFTAVHESALAAAAASARRSVTVAGAT
jgi:hypothetical protein